MAFLAIKGLELLAATAEYGDVEIFPFHALPISIYNLRNHLIFVFYCFFVENIFFLLELACHIF